MALTFHHFSLMIFWCVVQLGRQFSQLAFQFQFPGKGRRGHGFKQPAPARPFHIKRCFLTQQADTRRAHLRTVAILQLQGAGDGGKQSGFACSIGPNQGALHSWVQRYVHAAEDFFPSVIERGVGEGDQGHEGLS